MTQAFTHNSKTLLSIDFDRSTTCSQICSYCYVENTERIYTAYAEKIKRNAQWAKDNWQQFAAQLNSEYWKLRNSKTRKLSRLSTMPVRIYGSGDYIPIHFEFFKLLEFKFYLISKTLASPLMENHLKKVLELPNCTKVILSLDSQNLRNYSHVNEYFGKDKIGVSFTGMADEFTKVKKTCKNFTIFFNISNKKVEREKSKLIKEQCPCDSGALAHNESCSYCNKCWRSSITKQKDWNGRSS